jgi:hypothetical protein
MGPKDIKTLADVRTWLKCHVEWNDVGSEECAIASVAVLDALTTRASAVETSEAERAHLEEGARLLCESPPGENFREYQSRVEMWRAAERARKAVRGSAVTAPGKPALKAAAEVLCDQCGLPAGFGDQQCASAISRDVPLRVECDMRTIDGLRAENARLTAHIALLETAVDMSRNTEASSCDQVNELLAENARLLTKLKEARGGAWIPVGERMPEPGDQVLFVAFGDVSCGPFARRWIDRLDTNALGESASYTEAEVTHWMSLPAPPTPEGE